METIFNHNPTEQELRAIRFVLISMCLKFGIEIDKELTPGIYKELASQQNAYYDLACLFEFRNDLEMANLFWEKLPHHIKKTGFGFDCESKHV